MPVSARAHMCIFHIQQHIRMIMLVPLKHNINLWGTLISPMTATAPFGILNEVCHWWKCAGDEFDNNLIEMSTTKMKRQDKILSLFNQTLKNSAASVADYSIWRPQSCRDFSSGNWRDALIKNNNIKTVHQQDSHLSIRRKGVCASTPVPFPPLWRWEIHQALFPTG